MIFQTHFKQLFSLYPVQLKLLRRPSFFSLVVSPWYSTFFTLVFVVLNQSSQLGSLVAVEAVQQRATQVRQTMAKFLPKQVYLSPKRRTKKILNKRPEVLLDQLALYKRFADARGSKCETDAVTPEMLLDNFKKILIEDGITVIKHGRQGDPHTRILHLVEKTMELAWQQVE